MAISKHDKKLDSILQIGDAPKRKQALVAYARSLDVDTEKTRKPNGEIDEDQLTVFIFNAARTRAFFRSRRIGFLAGIFFIFITLIVLMFIFFKF